MVAIFLGVAVVVLILIQFAAASPAAGVSTNLTSAGNTMNSLLPAIAYVVGGGLFMVALGASRRGH
jgi:hypothetical protein